MFKFSCLEYMDTPKGVLVSGRVIKDGVVVGSFEQRPYCSIVVHIHDPALMNLFHRMATPVVLLHEAEDRLLRGEHV